MGDLFDKRKNLDIQTVEYAKTCLFDQLIEKNIDFHVILGNHDVYYRNTNDINSIEMLFRDSPFKIYKSAVDVSFDGTSILLCPWINDENYADTVNTIKKSKSQILMGHLELAGFKMDKFNVAEHGMKKELFDKFDVVCSGHYHHKSTTGNINYLGSHMQFTWSDCDDERGFHVFDTVTRELTFIENPDIMFYKLTDPDKLPPSNLSEGGYLRVILDHKLDEVKFTGLLDKLEKFKLSDSKFIEAFEDDDVKIEDQEHSLTETENTMSIVNKYVDALDTDINKTYLKKIMADLYKSVVDIS